MFNNDAYLALRSGFQNGNINLLISENTAEEFIRKNVKGYSKMSSVEQMQYIAPYVQTSLMIEELAKLEHENKNGKIAVKERSGMRKDRASSITYSYHVAQILARNLKPKKDTTTNYNEIFKIRTPKIGGRRF